MKIKYLLFALVLFAFSCNTATSKSELEADLDELKAEIDSLSDGYELVWSDEFDTDGLPDSTKWGYDIGGHGWGNNEAQFYTDKELKNARVEGGKLIIEAIKEDFEEKKYTSARLVTKNKGDWKYGKFVIRAKLPRGKGSWAAIWMLPTKWDLGNGGWPDCGEIDIMEYVGYEKDTIHGTVHCQAYNHIKGTQKGKKILIPNAENEFHDYVLEWTEDKIEIFVDDQKYFDFSKEEGWEKWPYFREFHLILNIAIGGNWGGVRGIDDTIFPQKMEVEYVKVYQKK